jgi:hypothetical protein
VRDKVESSQKSIVSKQFKRTKDIIDNIEKLPDKLMITVHPERWTDNIFEWTQQLIFQNIKNVVKRILVNRM